MLVHDAARPLVDDAVRRAAARAARRGLRRRGARLPVADTLKRVRDGVVVETVDRTGLVAAQTPQAFLAPMLRRGVRGRPRWSDRLRVARRARRGPCRGRRGRTAAAEDHDSDDLALVESWL